MIISKKLAITQTILLTILFILSITLNILGFVSGLNEILSTEDTNEYSNVFFNLSRFTIISWVIQWIGYIPVFVLGILQIVYAIKRGEGGIYLASGILAVIPIMPILPPLICNIIGIVKKNRNNNEMDNLNQEEN